MGKRKHRHKELSRSEAKSLFEKGWAIIDTSGRTREIREKSAMGMASNTVNLSVLFKSHVKAEIFKKHLKNMHREELITAMHCAGIHYLLKDSLDKLPGVFICSDGLNIGRMTHQLKRIMGSAFVEEKIRIHTSLKPMLGKKNRGDRLAHSVNKLGRSANMVFTSGDIEKYGCLKKA